MLNTNKNKRTFFDLQRVAHLYGMHLKVKDNEGYFSCWEKTPGSNGATGICFIRRKTLAEIHAYMAGRLDMAAAVNRITIPLA